MMLITVILLLVLEGIGIITQMGCVILLVLAKQSHYMMWVMVLFMVLVHRVDWKLSV